MKDNTKHDTKCEIWNEMRNIVGESHTEWIFASPLIFVISNMIENKENFIAYYESLFS